MKAHAKHYYHYSYVVILLLVFLLPIDQVSAADRNSDALKQLSARWWQWSLSIPVDTNPMLDATGENCMIGQNGPIWYLAGIFGPGTGTRTCSIPQDKTLFFPIVNNMVFDSPNVCQGPDSISLADLRKLVVDGTNQITFTSVTLDGKPVKFVKRVSSVVFAVTLPKNNVFDEPCVAAGLGHVPADVYSPAVDDGYYAVIRSLEAGAHTLHFVAKAGDTVVQDVTYDLKIVPVKLK